MMVATPRSTVTRRFRLLFLGAILASPLVGASCASALTSPYVFWTPGTYEFQATHPHAGVVRGTIQVQEEGPVGVVTDVLGTCVARAALVPGHRARAFHCGGDYSVRIQLGQRGQDPVVGQVSNRRTWIQTRQVRSNCRQWSPSPDGRRVCVQWAYRTVEERMTTGAEVRFRLVLTAWD